MDNPGVYTLAALGITTALTAQAQTAILELDGMSGADLVAAFAYGSGGTSCSALVQTSFDGGTTWLDVCRFDFTTAAATKRATLQRGSHAVAAYAALGSEGVNDSLLGDQLRAVITSVGTYVGTTLSLRAAVS